jgi:hypothetical protein
MFKDVQKRKIGYSGALLSLLSNTSRLNVLGDPSKKLQQNLWASHVLKSAWDNLRRRSNSLVQNPFVVNDHLLER